MSNLDSDPGGRCALEELQALRNKYAGYFEEEEQVQQRHVIPTQF